MRSVKLYIILIATLMAIFIFGCSNSDSNPVTTPPVDNTTSLKGTWTFNYTGTNSNSGVDSLSVTLNIDGSDDKLGGSGSVAFVRISGGATFRTSSTDAVTGTFSDTNINGATGDFSFTGNKSGSNYTGTAVYIIASNLFIQGDTLTIQNATFKASN